MGFYNPGTAPNNYLGTWNASTNSPTLASSVGPSSPGSYYVVSTSGTTNLNGISDWTVGDWVIWSGSVWQKLEGGATTVTVATTNVVGGTANGVLWNNGGVLGGGPITTTSAGVTAIPSGGSLSINGATIGTDALAITGTASVSTSVSSPLFTGPPGNLIFQGTSGSSVFVNALGAGDINMRIAGSNALTISSARAVAMPVSLAIGGATIGSNALAVTGTTTLSSLLTITQATANTGIIASTGYSLTGTDATSMVNLAGTWNTSGTPTLIKANITDTASNASSLLMDLQVGGVSKFGVAKTGGISSAAGASFASSISTSTLQINAAGVLIWATRSQLDSSANGIITLYNNAATDFSRLNFGGNTSSFPAIKRNAAALNFRLADDSADAAITTAAITSSGIHTITQATANTGIIASTGYSLTGTDATSMVNLAGTWNTTGVPTAIKLNITNTASGAGSLLMDLQVGAASKFSVDTVGNTSIAGSASFNTSTGSCSFYGSIALGSARVVAWGSGSIGSTDTGLSRISAGVVGFGNGTAANISGGIQAATLALGGATIGSDALGVAGSVTFGSVPATNKTTITAAGIIAMTQATSSGDVLTVNGSGNGIRVVSGYVQAATIIPNSTGSILFGGGGSRTSISAPADSQLLLQNNAGTDFGRLQFGGTTSSFPAWKRNSTSLEARLADDSAQTRILALDIVLGQHAIIGAGYAYNWNGRSGIYSPSDGVIGLYNNAATDFSRLQFGGTTSSFPAIKRNSVRIEARLADDSAYTDVYAANFVNGTGTGQFGWSGTGVRIRSGTGSPEGAISAPVGSLWLRDDGGANTTLYVKESGTGNTGWVAK